jgi:hypothetical protein
MVSHSLHRYSPTGPTLGSHKGELLFQAKPLVPYAFAAPKSHGSPAYVVYMVGGDPVDHQFFSKLPKEIPHGYMCAYIPDSNNPVHSVQRAAKGVSRADTDKQAWLAAYATGPSHDSTHSAPGAQTVDQISAILRDQFGILPKRRAIDYTKPYPSEYDLIPLPPKYRLPEFTKFSGSEGSSSIEHVSRYLAQLGMISVLDPLQVRFFSQSLTGPAFGWYTSWALTRFAPGRSWRSSFTFNTTRKPWRPGLLIWHKSGRSEGKPWQSISSASERSRTDATRPIF